MRKRVPPERTCVAHGLLPPCRELPPGETTMEHDGWKTLGSRVADAADAAQRRFLEYRDRGFDQVWDDVVSYFQAQPVNALLVAAGVGMIVGTLSGLRRR